MILVTGATGHVGGELVAQLAARPGADGSLRAMTRRPDRLRLPATVQVVYGDADDPDSLDAAFAGVDAAFLMSAQPVGSAPGPTHDVALAAAAERAGVRHVVKLSVFDGGAGEDPIGLWHRQAEAAVTGRGFDWTLLRPGRFASNALQWAPMIRRGDTVTIPFGTRPAAPIDPADVAAVAVAALTSDGYRGAAPQLSGPQVLTPEDELRILAGTLGRSLRFVEPPLDASRAQMVRYGMPERVVDAVIARVLSDDDSGARVLPTVESVLGRPPTAFAEWAKAHTHAFLSPGEDEAGDRTSRPGEEGRP
jgi:uncharacterized protein YbjT (DUF2867 family)